MMREVRCAREDRVFLVKFLIIQKEFRLVQSHWRNVGGTYDFIMCLDFTFVLANLHENSPAF
jgi:hypothetical protein